MLGVLLMESRKYSSFPKFSSMNKLNPHKIRQ